MTLSEVGVVIVAAAVTVGLQDKEERRMKTISHFASFLLFLLLHELSFHIMPQLWDELMVYFLVLTLLLDLPAPIQQAAAQYYFITYV